eukprot:151727-Heterocapsa_arctica.AAC.1
MLNNKVFCATTWPRTHPSSILGRTTCVAPLSICLFSEEPSYAVSCCVTGATRAALRKEDLP